MGVDVQKDYYAILGIPSLATSQEIKRAYHRLARRYHPDSREADTATHLFHQVQEAYVVLSDPDTRRAYDRQRDELARDKETALAYSVLLSRKQLYSKHEEQVFYALLEIGHGVTSGEGRLPLELAMVIDRSTSMKGIRLENVKEAARQIVDKLHEDDNLAIIGFNDRADVLLSDQVGPNRAHAKATITALQAEGGTEILHGLRAGLRELRLGANQDTVSHLILLTDGRTYGDDEACLAVAERAGERGIGITALGIGEDWNDDLLDAIASRTGGTSIYIASPSQVRTVLQKRVRSLGSVFATGLVLSMRTADGVWVENAFKTSPSLERLQLSDGVARLGSLEVGTPLRILLEIGVARRSPGDYRLAEIQLYGDVPSLDRRNERLTRDIWCTFTDDAPVKSAEKVPAAILNTLSRITLYRMQEKAWSALGEGRVERAKSQLEMVADRLLDIGEKRLAQTAMLEAEHITRQGNPTAQGRKRIKYGTRGLDVGGESYD